MRTVMFVAILAIQIILYCLISEIVSHAQFWKAPHNRRLIRSKLANSFYQLG